MFQRRKIIVCTKETKNSIFVCGMAGFPNQDGDNCNQLKFTDGQLRYVQLLVLETAKHFCLHRSMGKPSQHLPSHPSWGIT